MLKFNLDRSLKKHMLSGIISQFAFNEFPDKDQKILEYDKTSTNFLTLRNAKNGYISPNGVFYPCGYASHEQLREYLQLVFNFKQTEVHPVDQNRLFENTFVKLTNPPKGYRQHCPPIMFWGEAMTARQKYYLGEWAKTNWKKSFFMKDGFYEISDKYIIDENRNVKMESK